MEPRLPQLWHSRPNSPRGLNPQQMGKGEGEGGGKGGSAAKVLDFIQIAWIFYPDDLDLDFSSTNL